MFWVRQGGGGGPRDETHSHKTAGWYHAALAFFRSAECSADIISGLSKTPPNNLRHMHAPDGRPLATRNACRGAMCLSSGWPKNCGKDTATVAPSPPMVWRRKRWKRNKHPPSEEESTGNIVQQSKLDFFIFSVNLARSVAQTSHLSFSSTNYSVGHHGDRNLYSTEDAHARHHVHTMLVYMRASTAVVPRVTHVA